MKHATVTSEINSTSGTVSKNQDGTRKGIEIESQYAASLYSLASQYAADLSH